MQCVVTRGYGSFLQVLPTRSMRYAVTQWCAMPCPLLLPVAEVRLLHQIAESSLWVSETNNLRMVSRAGSAALSFMWIASEGRSSYLILAFPFNPAPSSDGALLL